MTITQRVSAIYDKVVTIRDRFSNMPSYAQLLSHDLFNYRSPIINNLKLNVRNVESHISMTWRRCPQTTITFWNGGTQVIPNYVDLNYLTYKTCSIAFQARDIIFKPTFLADHPLRLDVISYLQAYFSISPITLIFRLAENSNYVGMGLLTNKGVNFVRCNSGAFPDPIGILPFRVSSLWQPGNSEIVSFENWLNMDVTCLITGSNGLDTSMTLNKGLCFCHQNIKTSVDNLTTLFKSALSLHP